MSAPGINLAVRARVLQALTYYAAATSYDHPLGSPCVCAMCEGGARAAFVLERWPKDASVGADSVVRPTLEFYATGAGLNDESAFGEGGVLARYALASMDPMDAELRRAVEDYPWVNVPNRERST
jgi:hypothetical protein